ncbi:MAG TPA: enoyl-CoA hydratase-related protein [Azospirillum sp.]|nr:enoyl-CoA hydratase-related protein [Azospirillum sp.]
MGILVERTGAVTVLIIDRPQARNALDPPTAAALREALLGFEADAEARVAVITGAGDKAFCAGADLSQVRGEDSPPAVQALDPVNQGLVTDPGLTKPLIAAINGYALGAGLELALVCDIRVAADTASFALPEVQIGSLPGSGGTQRLSRVVGLGPALHLTLTGERVDAAEALRIGLVTRVVPAAELRSEAMRIAERIAANAPLSVRAAKRAVRQGAEMDLAAGLALERLLFTTLKTTEDRAEGRRAFAEKRSPRFTGR